MDTKRAECALHNGRERALDEILGRGEKNAKGEENAKGEKNSKGEKNAIGEKGVCLVHLGWKGMRLEKGGA